MSSLPSEHVHLALGPLAEVFLGPQLDLIALGELAVPGILLEQQEHGFAVPVTRPVVELDLDVTGVWPG